MDTFKILVFPCGTEIANEIIGALKNHKYFKTVFASSEKETYCHYRGEKVHILPYISDKNFKPTLQKLIREESIDFIIPAHDDVAYGLSMLEEELDLQIIGQNRSVNEIVRFKDRTYRHFRNILPIAKVYLDEESLEFPLFVKPKRGQGSQNSFSLRNEKEFSEFKQRYDAEEFVWMELLTGEEYTIDCFSDKGELLYAGTRTRDKTNRGISVISRLVTDEKINSEINGYAKKISENLQMHGIWFFQMKRDKKGNLKLLEIGPRVSGTMMLNRVRGVNFVELAIYQKMGLPVEVVYNADIDVSLARALVPRYKTDIRYDNLYVDFDDTLLLEEKYINTDLMKLIFQAKNENKKVFLITKNKKNNLAKTLHRFGISHIFDEIIHLHDNQKKTDYLKPGSVLIDDSFAERKDAIEKGFYAFGCDSINLL